MSKKQTSVESSSFGSKFIAMKQCCECIHGLWHKLRTMGTPTDGPTCIFGDNQSVLANALVPDSALKKKSQSIACHFVHEGAARDEWRTVHVNRNNKADLLTKLLPLGDEQTNFVRSILHHVFESNVMAVVGCLDQMRSSQTTRGGEWIGCRSEGCAAEPFVVF